MKEETKKSILTVILISFLWLIVYFFNDFIKEFSDSLMVVITFIYVCATTIICMANIKSAEATRAQVEETKRQFEENERLSFLPILKINLSEKANTPPNIYLRWPKDDRNIFCNTFFQLDLLNIGIGTAKDISYTWMTKEEIIQSAPLPCDFMRQNDKLNLSFDVTVFTNKPKTTYDLHTALRIRYSDLLNHRYHQVVNLVFTVSEDWFRLSGYSIEQAEHEDTEDSHA